MCASRTDPNACLWRAAGFGFNCAGPIDGMHCVNVDEPEDASAAWADNNFCSAEDIGLEWSADGPLEGMSCVQITEPAEDPAEGWDDDYLCASASAPVAFTWSHAGPLATGVCIRWYEPADAEQSWTDNWLCIQTAQICNGADDDGDGEVDEGVCPDADEDAGAESSDAGGGIPATDDGSEDGCSCRAARPTHGGALAALLFVTMVVGWSGRRLGGSCARCASSVGGGGDAMAPPPC
jgi:hypothetical protein